MDFVLRVYKYLNEEIADPRTNKWLFVDSPFIILLIVGFYWYFVFKLGRVFMEHRKPYNLNTIMILYNVAQVLLSTYIVVETIRAYFWRTKANLFCDPVKVSTEPLYMYHAFLVYLYFIAKITELLDTVFFILRKKWNQVTPLHLWHHSGMVGIAWVAVKYVPGGQSMLTCSLNSFVHIVMYVYYLLLSLRPELRKSIWWKKHITQLQLIQFAIILIHHLFSFTMNCGYPRGLSYAILNNTIFITLLFADFYRRAYMTSKEQMKGKSN